MRFGPLAAIPAVVVSLSGGPALAAVCLDKSMTLDEIVDAINARQGCERAMKLFEDCSLGSGGDSQLGAAVEKKCEADFLDKANASKKQAYKRELGVCDRKYRNQSGTMYISFTAFCRAEVAQRYAREMRRAAGAK